MDPNRKRHSREVFSGVAIAVSAALVLLAAEAAWSQANPLGETADKINEIFETFRRIMRIFFLAAGLLLGYRWMKGDHEARNATEKYLVGVVIAFGVTEILLYFGGA